MRNNLNTLVFLAGFAVFEAGAFMVSPPMGSMVGGVILMGIGVYPYLRRRLPP